MRELHYKDSLETDGFRLAVDEKNNSTRPYKLKDYINLRAGRKTIESIFSTIRRPYPKECMLYVPDFELKVVNFVFCSYNYICCLISLIEKEILLK